VGLIIFGCILILTGIVIPFLYYTYTYNRLTGQVISYEFPLLPYGVLVAILGAVVIVIGLIIKNEPTTSAVPPHVATPTSSTLKKYCRFCGAENNSDAIFCEKCGKQIG
jgi:hypothetical protein